MSEFPFRTVEEFASIQGEGILLGKPVYFIRLPECTLNCQWCDSKYANIKYQYEKLESSRIYEKDSDIIRTVSQIRGLGYSHIIFTGGEPLSNDNIKIIDLFKPHCLRNDLLIHVESNLVPDKKTFFEGNVIDFVKGVIDMPVVNITASPKLDVKCYNKEWGVTYEDILRYFIDSDVDPKQLVGLNNFLNFKLVYYPEVEDNVIEFVDAIHRYYPGFRIYIMPFTPIDIYFKPQEFNRSAYTHSCKQTIDFCKKK